MLKYLLAAFLSFTLSCASAQVIEWQNTIGGSQSDYLYKINTTADGGYICGGFSISGISGDKTQNTRGDYDYWIVKLDSTGTVMWDKTLGGNQKENLWDIRQTNDGGYICGGMSLSGISGDKTEINKGAFDYWVVKLDSLGQIQWQKTIGGLQDEWLNMVQQTSDGGYICGGMSLSGISGDKTEINKGAFDYWVVKLDSLGQIQWQKTIGGSGNDVLRVIHQTSDGGYICGGSSASDISGDKTENSLGIYDFWLVKIGQTGALQWQSTISANKDNELFTLELTTDGGYILGGYSNSGISGDKTEICRGKLDFWVVKTDSAGQPMWDKTLGGSRYDQLYSVEPKAGSGYLCSGFSNSKSTGDKSENGQGFRDLWVVMLDTNGHITWQKSIGSGAEDYLHTAKTTTDGGVILGGQSSGGISGDKTEPPQGLLDYWVVKLCNVAPFSISTSGPTTFCQGDSVLLSAPLTFSNLQWYHNGIILPGQTSNTIAVYDPGQYYCISDDSIMCDAVSNSIQVQVPCIPTDPNEWKVAGISLLPQLLLSPNPAHDRIGICPLNYNPHYGTSLVMNYQIYNLLGEVVKTGETISITCDKSGIDISELEPGLYLIRSEGFAARFVKN